jgi:hypothetical protein
MQFVFFVVGKTNGHLAILPETFPDIVDDAPQ